MVRYNKKFEFNRRFSAIVDDMIDGHKKLVTQFIRLHESIEYYTRLTPSGSFHALENSVRGVVLRFDVLDYSLRNSLVNLYNDFTYVVDFKINNPFKEEALQAYIERSHRLALEAHDEILKHHCYLDMTLIARLLDIAEDLDYHQMCTRYRRLAKWPTIETDDYLKEQLISALGGVIKSWKAEGTDSSS